MNFNLNACGRNPSVDGKYLNPVAKAVASENFDPTCKDSRKNTIPLKRQ
jgi:hypothetical protein